MPKFLVTLQQFHEETAQVTIYAPTAAQAKRLAIEMFAAGDIDPDWSDGDEITPAKAVDAGLTK